MGSIEPRRSRTRDGHELVVRTAAIPDTPALLELRRDIARTSEEVLTQEDEIPADPARQTARIEKATDDPGSLLLVAEAGGRLVGCLNIHAGDRRRSAHTCDLGIGIASGWRSRGVGNALFEAAMDWAGAHPRIEKVCLGVFPTNTAGRALYRKFGFEDECVRPGHARHDDGRYVDLIFMARWVKGGPP